MKVKELIESLQKLFPDDTDKAMAEIYVDADESLTAAVEVLRDEDNDARIVLES